MKYCLHCTWSYSFYCLSKLTINSSLVNKIKKLKMAFQTVTATKIVFPSKLTTFECTLKNNKFIPF